MSIVSHSRKRLITSSGQKDQVDIAKSLVLAVMTKGPAGVAEYGNSQTVEVGFPCCAVLCRPPSPSPPHIVSLPPF